MYYFHIIDICDVQLHCTNKLDLFFLDNIRTVISQLFRDIEIDQMKVFEASIQI